MFRIVDETAVNDEEDVTCYSQRSSGSITNASQTCGNKRSTPANSQDTFDHVSFSQAISEIVDPPTKKLKLKYSKADAIELMKGFNTCIDAAGHILEELSGHKFEDVLDSDANEIESAKVKLGKKLAKLNESEKSRKFRYNKCELNVTFVDTDTYDIINKVKVNDASKKDFSLTASASFESIDEEDTSSEMNKAQDSTNLDLTMLERVENVEDSRGPEPNALPRNPVFAFRKPLDQLLDNKTLKQRSREDYENFQEVSTKQGVTLSQLVGHFLHRYFYNSNKRLASLGGRLFKGETEEIG